MLRVFLVERYYFASCVFIKFPLECIKLKGPLPQQIKQLRAREKELLNDIEKLEATVNKLKEDRSHYRRMTDDYR